MHSKCKERLPPKGISCDLKLVATSVNKLIADFIYYDISNEVQNFFLSFLFLFFLEGGFTHENVSIFIDYRNSDIFRILVTFSGWG